MGAVYRASDTTLRREVAVKVLHDKFVADPDRLRRFEREALATAALNHPHIIAVYDVGTHDGTAYVVSELLEGRTLQGILATGPLPSASAGSRGVAVLPDGGLRLTDRAWPRRRAREGHRPSGSQAGAPRAAGVGTLPIGLAGFTTYDRGRLHRHSRCRRAPGADADCRHAEVSADTCRARIPTEGNWLACKLSPKLAFL